MVNLKLCFYKNLLLRKNVKPFFVDKGVNSSKTTLIKKNSIVVNESKIANIMNNYFISITKTFNLKRIKAKLIQTSLIIILA